MLGELGTLPVTPRIVNRGPQHPRVEYDIAPVSADIRQSDEAIKMNNDGIPDTCPGHAAFAWLQTDEVEDDNENFCGELAVLSGPPR